jgi:hypothetical protein
VAAAILAVRPCVLGDAGRGVCSLLGRAQYCCFFFSIMFSWTTGPNLSCLILIVASNHTSLYLAVVKGTVKQTFSYASRIVHKLKIWPNHVVLPSKRICDT